MRPKNKMIPCQSREAVVTVLSYYNGIVDGYLQHPYLMGKEKIQSLSQLILLLNDLAHMDSCPTQALPLAAYEDSKGEGVSVFRIQILFHEHYTWQGRLIWQIENQEIVFRSAIELMQLLDEILGE